MLLTIPICDALNPVICGSLWDIDLQAIYHFITSNNTFILMYHTCRYDSRKWNYVNKSTFLLYVSTYFSLYLLLPNGCGVLDQSFCFPVLNIAPRIKMKSVLKRYFQGLSNGLFQSGMAPILKNLYHCYPYIWVLTMILGKRKQNTTPPPIPTNA